MKRHIIEGTWAGYTSAQERVAHREVTIDKKLIEKLKTLRTIVFTDNTCLIVTCRPANYREKVIAVYGYSKLIREAAHLKYRTESRVVIADMVDKAK